MPQTRRMLTSWSKGELSPRLDGHMDIAAYFEGARTAENMLCSRQGGMFRRYGTRMVKEVKDSSQDTIVMAFEFSVDDSYILEVGDLYIRVYKNRAAVLNAGVHVEIATPFVVADIRSIHTTQSADVLFMFHSSYQQRKLSRISDTNWTLSIQNVSPPPSFEADTDLGDTVALAANTGTGIVARAGSAIFLAADDGRQIVSGSSLAVITSVTNTTEVVVDIVNDFTQTITPAINALTSVGTAVASTAHGAVAGQFALLTSGPQSGQIREIDSIVDVDNFLLVTGYTVNQVAQAWTIITPIASGAWGLRQSPQTTLDPNKKGPIGATLTLVSGAAAFRAADVGKYISIYGGIVLITVFTNTTTVKGIIKSVMGDATTDDPAATPAGSWFLQIASWSAINGYPRTGEFYQGRLYQASTNAEPTAFWGSRADDFDNYAIGIAADDAVSYTLASRQVNRIEWLADNQYLFLGTTGTEHKARGGGVGDMIPIGGDATPNVTRVASNGCLPNQPIVMNLVALYGDRSRRKILRMGTDVDNDGFMTKELTVGAEHITESGIRLGQMAFEKRLDQRLWFVREDGTLVTMSFFPEEKISAFTRLVTEGTFESVAIIAEPGGGADQVWVVAKRIINGQTKRFVEVFDADLNTDCAVSEQGANDTVLMGLDHLNGATVDVLSNQSVEDGWSYVGQRTVAGGQVTLPESAPGKQAGLHYDSTLTTMRPGIPGQVIEGLPRSWDSLFLRLLNSRGGKINGASIQYAADPLGTAPLFSGDVKVTTQEWDTTGRFTIVQDQPYPFHVLCAFGTLSLGEHD